MGLIEESSKGSVDRLIFNRVESIMFEDTRVITPNRLIFNRVESINFIITLPNLFALSLIFNRVERYNIVTITPVNVSIEVDLQ